MIISDKTIEIVEKEQKCIGCNACMKGCPMLDRFCDSPKTLLKKLLDEKSFDYKLPYSCMQCGYCTKVCPVDVDLKHLFMELRKDTVNQTDGKLPKDLNTSNVAMHQKLSFTGLFSKKIQHLESDTVFFPGCALQAYSPDLVEKVYSYIRKTTKGAGYYNVCCAKPTKMMGKDSEFQKIYLGIDEEFKRRKVKRVITGCQNCYMTILSNSPDIEVISLWEYIDKSGVPAEAKNKYKIKKDEGSNTNKSEYSFVLHDPCPTRDVDSIHVAVRNIIAALGIEIDEMKYSKGRTLCCGAGGMVAITQNDIAKAHMRRRATEKDADYILTYCQECVESMRRGGSKSLHILDLIFLDDFLEVNQGNQSTLDKWKNRFIAKTARL